MLDFVHFIDLHLDISIYFLKSGDDNDRDEDLQKDKDKDKDTQRHTKKKTKCLQGPMYAIFFQKQVVQGLTIARIANAVQCHN